MVQNEMDHTVDTDIYCRFLEVQKGVGGLGCRIATHTV